MENKILNKAKNFIHFREKRTEPTLYYGYVAVGSDVIIGTDLIYEGRRLDELRKPVWSYHRPIRSNYTRRWTQAGEYSMDSIGVINHLHQGKRSWSQLLQLRPSRKAISKAIYGPTVDKREHKCRKNCITIGFKPLGRERHFWDCPRPFAVGKKSWNKKVR